MTFDAALPAGGTTPVTVYITHDNTDLYVAVTFDRTHDFSIDVPPPTTVGVTMQVSLEADPSGANTYTHTHYPSSTTYCQLTIGKKSTSLSCPAA